MDLLKHVSTHHVEEPCEKVEMNGLVNNGFQNEHVLEKREVVKEDNNKLISCL